MTSIQTRPEPQHIVAHTTFRYDRLTLLLSFTAPSSDAPVYLEQKSNKPSKTGLKERKETFIDSTYIR